MKSAGIALLFVVALSSCTVGVGVRPGRYGSEVVVAPDYWGTVTSYDPVGHRVELDYVDAGVHRTRTVYYEPRNTRWDGFRETDLRVGASIHVHGRQGRRNRWVADSFGRDDGHR